MFISLGFPTEEAGHELLLWKISEWVYSFCYITLIVCLCLFSWKAVLVFYPLISRSQKLLKWAENLFWEGEGMKLLSDIDIMYNEDALLGNSIITLGGYKVQLQ